MSIEANTDPKYVANQIIKMSKGLKSWTVQIFFRLLERKQQRYQWNKIILKKTQHLTI